MRTAGRVDVTFVSPYSDIPRNSQAPVGTYAETGIAPAAGCVNPRRDYYQRRVPPSPFPLPPNSEERIAVTSGRLARSFE
jgi:hypothetical protein